MLNRYAAQKYGKTRKPRFIRHNSGFITGAYAI